MQSPTYVLRAEPSASPPPQCFPEGFSPFATRLIMGTQLFGSNAAWLLLAFLATQIYTYYTRSAKDHPLFKTLVYSTAFIAMTESAVEGFVAYSFLVSGWGNPLLLAEPSVALGVLADLQPLFDALPALFVQFYFTWRIWAFCSAVCGRTTKFLVGAICIFIILTSICAFISAIILTVLLITGPNGTIPSGTIVLVWTVSTAVADVTITSCMMSILYHAKSSSYFGETRDRLSRLLRLTIQTGFLTSVLAIPIAPLYFRVQVGIYTLTCFLLGKSYVISLLANLNARSYRPTLTFVKGKLEPDVHGVGAGTEMTVPHLTTIAFTPGQSPADSQNEAITTPDSDNGGGGVLSYIRSVAHTIHDPNLQFQPDDSDSPNVFISQTQGISHTRSRSKSFSDREARYAPPGLGLVYGKAKDREGDDIDA